MARNIIIVNATQVARHLLRYDWLSPRFLTAAKEATSNRT